MANITKEAGTIKFKGLVDIQEGDNPTQTDVDITTQGEWSSNQDWAHIDNTGLVNYEENTGEERKAIITLKYKDLTDTEELIQAGTGGGEPEPIEPHYKDLVLTGQTVDYPIDQVSVDGGITGVKGTATYVNEAGEEKKGIDVTNKLIFVSSSDNNCIKGDEEYYLIWNVNENSNSRSSTITYKLDGQEDLTATIITTQLGIGGGTEEDILEVEPEEVIFEYNGGNQEITIISNVDWTIE